MTLFVRDETSVILDIQYIVVTLGYTLFYRFFKHNSIVSIFMGIKNITP